MNRGGRNAADRDPGLWTSDWSNTSYWLDGLSPPDVPQVDLPPTVDVLIVGSGYTGLNAAIETARGGRSTLVVEAETPGWGCSSRNGGQVGTGIKPSLAKLTSRHGADRAKAIRAEGDAALQWIEDRIVAENISCDFQRSGRIHAAHTPEAYEVLAREADLLRRTENTDVGMISRAEQRVELGTDTYHGAAVFAAHGALDPALYMRGLLQTALNAGAEVLAQTRVLDIVSGPQGHEVRTSRGVVRAREVIVATNGYTVGATPWHQRRVIPIGSYIIATEPLDPDLVDRLFPTGRVVTDTCKVIYYYRTSPDRRRVLFGGRVSAGETDPAVSGPRLHKAMCQIFPELRATRISHSWSGTVAYTFDELAHTGTHDGVHYAMGYCGSGVAMSSYLGMRMGQKVLGLAEGRTAFDDLSFPTRPFYTGRPWFLPAAVAWYRWRDGQQRKRAGQGARDRAEPAHG
ncbi:MULTISPECIES: NAD(P)/FAD-dependent oxidoreductase [Roseobacteraceae]|uniref:Gamma-glutamylputrescine oxidoreductase n=1 Tax=Pseudosulfitobacter pseudonitzschiae TaxID=1402135 RepID=A0A221JXU3_9RHOB|nr:MULTISPECIES: FAD-binding oxidoreductase [Roseobacteraceae]ASM71572.1 gamma-glutamylputrescine oxidoreductase [Pseudosulfitobacter pseudonitzschiae]